MDLAWGWGKAAFYYIREMNLHVSERDFSDYIILSFKIRCVILKLRKININSSFSTEKETLTQISKLNILKRELISWLSDDYSAYEEFLCISELYPMPQAASCSAVGKRLVER